jgi:hypothetical protein
MAQNDSQKRDNFTDKFREFLKYVLLLVLFFLSIPFGFVILREYLHWKPITEQEYMHVLQFILFFTIGVWLLSKAITIVFNALYFARNYSQILDRQAENDIVKAEQAYKPTKNPQNGSPSSESRGVGKGKGLVPNEVVTSNDTPTKVTRPDEEIISIIKAGYIENLPEEFSSQEKDVKASDFIDFVGSKYGYNWNLVYSDIYESTQKPEEILESAGKFLESS